MRDIFRTLSVITNSDIFRHIHVLFRHIQPYCGIFRTLCNPCPLVYSELCHIQNPGIFWTQDIFRTLSRHILAYSECCITFSYQEHCHTQNLTLFKILAYLGPKKYSESCLFRHIQAYLIRIVTMPFHFHFNLTYFLTKFEKTYVFWLQWRQFCCLTWV